MPRQVLSSSLDSLRYFVSDSTAKLSSSPAVAESAAKETNNHLKKKHRYSASITKQVRDKALLNETKAARRQPTTQGTASGHSGILLWSHLEERRQHLSVYKLQGEHASRGRLKEEEVSREWMSARVALLA